LPRELAGGATWHGFRPEGERFRELVTVNLETDRDGCIADAKLCLDRAFIEHAKEGALARDPGTTGSSTSPTCSSIRPSSGFRARDSGSRTAPSTSSRPAARRNTAR
jgi:hypothetical protein